MDGVSATLRARLASHCLLVETSDAHAQALALFADLGAAADAAELKALIGTLEASVQQHYDHAEALFADL
jgi:hypothetical protein